MIRTLALTPLLALVICLSASAQNLSVRTLAMRAGEFPKVFIKIEDGYKQLEFDTAQPTATVQAISVNPLPIYKEGLDKEGNPTMVLDQKVKIPGGSAGVLLLSMTDGKVVRFVPIPDDFGAAKFNDWLLINAATKPVLFQVGEGNKPSRIDPGKSKDYRINVENGRGAAVTAVAPDKDGNSKKFYSTFWPVQEGRRSIVIFADDGRKIRVKRISDFFPPPKEKTTP